VSITVVKAQAVGLLLAENLNIPHYQRPYSWRAETAVQLLDDIRHAMSDTAQQDVPYVLGAVILHDTGSGGFDVVDGQQRLITLHLILDLLSGASGMPFTAIADNPIGQVHTALQRQIHPLSGEQRSALGRFIREKCEFVRVVTDDIDEAFRVFDSQNYRGKPLAPHDLLKAYHLREMRNETAAMKAAVVEAWESVRDADLDRLFSTYLYRIARWSRGQSAPKFTVQDIGMFKGVSPKAHRSPSARYHVAAQVAMPLLHAWNAASVTHDDRDAQRSRFQLDAPIVAGRPFFEMVTFMLGELKQLAYEGFKGERANFSVYDLAVKSDRNGLVTRVSRDRYRYVSELFLAALLYYTNKFGDEDLESASSHLFAWAYALRIQLEKVQFRSMDNRAKDDRSAFMLMRNAESGRVVRQLPTSATPKHDNHETTLIALLGSTAP